MIENAQETKRDQLFEVWPENWPIVRMFMRLQTQWVIGGMGHYVGINYQSVEVLFRIYMTKNKRRMLEGLQIMEAAALGVFRKQEQKD